MLTLPQLTARLAIVATFGALLVTAYDSQAQSIPTQVAYANLSPSVSSALALGAASSFAVLGGPAVTCTRSALTGDVGVASTPAFTNTGCTVSGNIHAGDAFATQAYNDFVNAYAALATKPCVGPPLTGTLAGVTLQPGVHCFSAAATVTGQLTLAGPQDAIWVFQVGTSGTGALTGTGFSVVMAGGAQACNVYWLVADAVTMTDSHLKGTILAGAGVTLTRGSLAGRALAKAAVTGTDIAIGSVCP